MDIQPKRNRKDAYPSAADRQAAAQIVALLHRHPEGGGAPAACRLVGPDQETVELSAAMTNVLEAAACILANGSGVSVLPTAGELTTQEAAHLLNVSRQYLVRLLDRGDIPAFKTGAHRRVRVEDLVAYKRRRDEARSDGLSRLAAMSQEIGGYDRD
jgi:excisionase family DNA binding protein